jgi:hypothetical protein
MLLGLTYTVLFFDDLSARLFGWARRGYLIQRSVQIPRSYCLRFQQIYRIVRDQTVP